MGSREALCGQEGAPGGAPDGHTEPSRDPKKRLPGRQKHPKNLPKPFLGPKNLPKKYFRKKISKMWRTAEFWGCGRAVSHLYSPGADFEKTIPLTLLYTPAEAGPKLPPRSLKTTARTPNSLHRVPTVCPMGVTGTPKLDPLETPQMWVKTPKFWRKRKNSPFLGCVRRFSRKKIFDQILFPGGTLKKLPLTLL